jgi:chromosome partitioning protein
MTYTIAVANEKGGVAKTTTALSLGGAIAESGRRILLIDLDPQANLTLGLGFKPMDLSTSSADIFLGNRTPPQAQRPTDISNIDLIPASQDLTMAERFLEVREEYETLLRKALQGSSNHEFILLDCPPALGPLAINAVTAADLLIIPTQCEFFSANSLRDMLNLVRNMRRTKNPNLHYHLLLTMVDEQNPIHTSLREHIRRAFSNAVFETMIEVDNKLKESPIFGKPITAYAPESTGANQYRALMEEIDQYIHETSRTTAQSA